MADGRGRGGHAARANPLRQNIGFCTAPDGVEIAYATMGSGPPLVKAPNWLSHLEFELESPVWRHVMQELSRAHMLVRFDQRANGLSDWDAKEVSLDAFVTDLETVVDKLGLECFPLLGVSRACAISVAYAARHPERVSRLVLYGGFARGPNRRGEAERKKFEALITLMSIGWGQDNPAFRQMFTSTLMPGATREQMTWFNDLQKASASPENALRLRNAVADFDVSDLLGQVQAPTLIMHCHGDAAAPFAESRRLAAGIPDARFVPLEGDNHVILERSWKANPPGRRSSRNFAPS